MCEPPRRDVAAELAPVNAARCKGRPPGLGSTRQRNAPAGNLISPGRAPGPGKAAGGLTVPGRGGDRRQARRQGETVGKQREASRSLRGGQPGSATLQRSAAGGPGRSGLSRRRAAGRRAPLPGSRSHRLSPGEGTSPCRGPPGRGDSAGSDPGVAARPSPGPHARAAEGQRCGAGQLHPATTGGGAGRRRGAAPAFPAGSRLPTAALALQQQRRRHGWLARR